jgi:hypothetical protein
MRSGRQICLSLGLICVLVLGIPLAGTAEITDLLSKVRLYTNFEEDYTNNLFLTNRNKQDDFITAAGAGLKVSALEEKKYGLDLDFLANYIFYAKNDNLNYFNPSGTLNAWYAAGPNLTFRIRDYLIRSDAAREQSYAQGGLPDQFLLSTIRGQQAIYFRNVVEPSMEYRFAKETVLSVFYRNNIYRIDNPRFEDSQENSITSRLNHSFDIRNSVSLDYFLTLGDYERSPDQLGQGIRGRYTYRFSPRASVFGEYSFENQNFKSPGVDYSVHNPSVGIEYKFSPTLSATAQAGYFWQVGESDSTGPSVNIGLTKTTERTTYTVNLQGGYTEDYFTAQNLGFAKYYRAYGNVIHRLTERINLAFTSSLERSTFTSGQKDWIWEVRGNASYQLLRWLNVFFTTSHREDHSNFDVASYSEYRVMVGAAATF